MNTITLSDYIGYIFTEIVKARSIADMHSKEIAERYAEDEVLKSFSVPRFKIPEMNLAIPVLVTGAKFANTNRFTLSEEAFSNMLQTQLNFVINKLKRTKVNFIDITKIKPIDISSQPIPVTQPISIGQPIPIGNLVGRSSNRSPISDSKAIFYKELISTQDDHVRLQITEVRWLELLQLTVKEEKLEEVYKVKNPNGELYFESLGKVVEQIENNYVIENVKVENLMVSPLTNIVKTEGDEKSVFTINAKIVEDGVFVKTVTDDQGKETKIVDFE